MKQKNYKSIDVHNTIALIYSTAVDPEQWPDLLNALASFADSLNLSSIDLEKSISDPQPRLSGDQTETLDAQGTTLSSVLHNLPLLDQANDPATPAIKADDITAILLSHFKNALNVSQRLVAYEEQKDMVSSLLDHLPVAILVVDSTSHILQSNNLARKILKSGDLVYQQDECLAVRDPAISTQLHETISKLAKCAPADLHDRMLMLDKGNDDCDSLMAYLSPIKSASNSLNDHSQVAILISRPKSQPFVLPQSFIDLYGLTKKENEVASLLIRGYSAKEIAEKKFLSEHTVRSHIKALLSKTGLKRQTDLIRFVLSGPGEGVISSKIKSMGDNDEAVKTLQLSDGRILTFREYGAANGRPLIFLHSVRGCHLEIENLAASAASDLGVRLIAPNRPGYGLSDPKQLDTVLDYVEDIAALADALKLERFDVAGYVLGGLFAKAVAYRLPHRVERLLLISCGVRAETTEDYSDMIPLYKMSNKLARELPQVIRMLSSIMVRGMLRNPERFLEQFATQLEPEEAALFESQIFEDRIIKGLQHAAYQGSRHIGQEVVLLNQPWGFDPTDIEIPVTLWHGEKDRHMPFILAKKLAGKIPDCQLQSIPDAGHFMAYSRMAAILEDFYSL